MRSIVTCALLYALVGAAHANPSRAQAALDRLQAEAPGLSVSWPADRLAPWRLSGLDAVAPGDSAAARAAGFLDRHDALLGLAEPPRFNGLERRGDRTIVRFEQLRGGVPVADHGVVVQLRGDRVVSVVNDAVPLAHVDPATLTAEQAWTLVADQVGVDSAMGNVRPVIFATGDQGVSGYEVDVVVDPFRAHLVVRVDGHRGAILGVRNRVIR